MALGFGHGLMHLNNHFLFNCQTTGTNRNMRLQQKFFAPNPPRIIKQSEGQKSTLFKLIYEKFFKFQELFCQTHILGRFNRLTNDDRHY